MHLAVVSCLCDKGKITLSGPDILGHVLLMGGTLLGARSNNAGLPCAGLGDLSEVDGCCYCSTLLIWRGACLLDTMPGQSAACVRCLEERSSNRWMLNAG